MAPTLADFERAAELAGDSWLRIDPPDTRSHWMDDGLLINRAWFA